MSELRLDSVSKLNRFLEMAVREAVELAKRDDTKQAELERQAAMKDDLRGLHAEEDDADVGLAEEEQEDASPSPAPVEEEAPEVDVEMVIDKLNVLRSGKSLRDEETRAQFTSYFESLDGGARQALFAFLEGMSGILVAGEEAEEAQAPADIGVEVQPAARKEKKAQVQDDASPIVVGESADKQGVLARLRELR